MGPWAGLAASLVTLGGAPPPTAVLAVGADAALVGTLQRRLEAELARAGVPVQGAEELARQAAASRPVAAGTPAGADELIAAAQNAYYEDRLRELDEVLSRLEALAEQDPRAVDPARVLLWRTALALAQGDGTAPQWAQRLVTLAPDVRVDLEVFRPSVRALVERARADVGPSYDLTVESSPARAAVRVDGRLITGSAAVLAGPHTVTAAAPGYREVVSTVQVGGTARVLLALPVDLPDDPSALLAQARTACAVVAEGGATQLRARVACAARRTRSSPAFPLGAAGEQQLAAWIRQALEPSGGWRATPSVAVGGAYRSRRIGAAGGADIDESHSGVAVRLGVELETPVGMLGDVELAYAAYPTVANAMLDSGETLRVGGGARLGVRAAVGYAWALGAGGGRVAALLGGASEWQRGPDVTVDGKRVGIFPSHAAAGVEARAGTDLPLLETDDLGALWLTLGVSLSPWRSWSEDPAGATGGAPAPAPSYGWEVGLGLRGAAALVILYTGGLGSVRFSGDAAAPHLPPLRDATVRDSVHMLVLNGSTDLGS